MIESPKNFIEQFQNFIEHIAGVMKTFLTKEVADNYYLGKTEKAASAGTADTATKATQDANGNVIPETYATKSELTSGLATKQPVGDYRTKSELDSIYLGINDKAKSAETADLANGITNLSKISVSSSTLVIISSNTFTAPSDGLFVGQAEIEIEGGDYNVKVSLLIDGMTYTIFSMMLVPTRIHYRTFGVFLKKGQVVTLSGYKSYLYATFAPVSLYANS